MVSYFEILTEKCIVNSKNICEYLNINGSFHSNKKKANTIINLIEYGNQLRIEFNMYRYEIKNITEKKNPIE